MGGIGAALWIVDLDHARGDLARRQFGDARVECAAFDQGEEQRQLVGRGATTLVDDLQQPLDEHAIEAAWAIAEALTAMAAGLAAVRTDEIRVHELDLPALSDVDDLMRLCRHHGLTLRWFDRKPVLARDKDRELRSLVR